MSAYALHGKKQHKHSSKHVVLCSIEEKSLEPQKDEYMI